MVMKLWWLMQQHPNQFHLLWSLLRRWSSCDSCSIYLLASWTAWLKVCNIWKNVILVLLQYSIMVQWNPSMTDTMGTNILSLLAGVPHSGLPVVLVGVVCVYRAVVVAFSVRWQGRLKQGLFILWVTALICNVKLLTTATIILLKRWTSVR